MADVFISYARDDREAARELAALVSAQGYEVWWDRELIPGDAYADVIEKTLDAAKVVIVLWSAVSRKSYWVRDEAAVGRDRGRLVPVALDAEPPPLGFRQLQTIDLQTLRNDERARQLLWTSLSSLCGRTAPAPPTPSSVAPTPAPAPQPTLPPPRAERSVHQILKEEKRQRSFVRTFWLTSFVISAIVALALGLLAGHTVSNAKAGGGIVALGSFIWMGVSLVLGRFLIVIGRRLSKRKSVRYFDIPTIICLVPSVALGLTILADKSEASVGDAVSMVPLLAGMVFPFIAALSIPIGFVRGLSRTTFAEGK